jgi:hypothetical protein
MLPASNLYELKTVFKLMDSFVEFSPVPDGKTREPGVSRTFPRDFPFWDD